VPAFTSVGACLGTGANLYLSRCLSWHRCQLFAVRYLNLRFVIFVTYAVTLLTPFNKYNAVLYYYFSAWLIFGVVVVAMNYFAPHFEVPYRVSLEEYENVEIKEE
jgi:hypothetical protein